MAEPGKREIRYDPDSLRQAIDRNNKNIDLYYRYIDHLRKENETLQDCLERETVLRKEEEGHG